MNELLDIALAAELTSQEQILWTGQPDPDSIRTSLLTFSILWLSGLFAISVGVLRDTPADQGVLTGLIFLLALVAGAGVMELIFVPRRASRTTYVISNKRVFTMSVTTRLGAEPGRTTYEKIVLRESRDSLSVFFMSVLPAQLLFLFLAFNAFTVLLSKFNPFIALGFALTTVGWMQPIIQDMRLPIPKFRDCARTLYAVGDIFVSLESLNLADYEDCIVKKAFGGLYNVFVLGKKSGCIRLRAIKDGPVIQQTLSSLKSKT